jgi:hypothetical protein
MSVMESRRRGSTTVAAQLYFAAIQHIGREWAKGCQCVVCEAVDRRSRVLSMAEIVGDGTPKAELSTGGHFGSAASHARGGHESETTRRKESCYEADVDEMTI